MLMLPALRDRKRHAHRATCRARRSYLRTLGVDAGLIAATPDAGLEQLVWDQRPMQLQLIPDAEAAAMDARRLRVQAMFDDSTPDEAASLLTFIHKRHIEPHEIGSFLPGGDAA